MTPVSRDRGLIFVHIPKAAGTTLRTVIDRQYPVGAIFHCYRYPTEPEFFALPEQTRSGLRVLVGHIPFGFQRHLPVPADSITMLRHPVDMVVSLYYYLLATRTPGFYPYAEGRTLTEFAECDLMEVRNMQTRMLSGVMEECTDETLAAAKRVLSGELTAFGLSERFDESLILFRRRLGWSNVFYTDQNVTRGRPPGREIPEAAIRAIEANNARDIELYTLAVRRFDEIVAAEGPGFRREVHAFRILNAIHGSLGTICRKAYSVVSARLKSFVKRRLAR